MGKKVAGMVYELPLPKLTVLKEYPFRTAYKTDKEVVQLVNDVEIHGLTVPLLVTPNEEGEYGIVDGYKRKAALEVLKWKKAPAIICKSSEAMATALDLHMSNRDLLPSEKARAYAMRYKQLRKELTLPKDALEEVATLAHDNEKNVQKYIYLSRLTEIFLHLVDIKLMSEKSGVEISFLSTAQQLRIESYIKRNMQMLSDMKYSQELITLVHAQCLREYAEQATAEKKRLTERGFRNAIMESRRFRRRRSISDMCR